MATRPRAVVVGGMLLDIQAGPNAGYEVVQGGSVPGYIMQTPGGVGRNIADCLARLCRSQAMLPPALVSVVGKDAAAALLLAHWLALGGSTESILEVDHPTPSLCAIIDQAGEVVGEIASVDTLEACLTPAALQQQAGHLSWVSMLILDANLPAATLEAACALPACQPRITWFEPVSAAKAVRGLSILRHLDYLSPNLDELVAIAALLCPDHQAAQASARLRGGAEQQGSAEQGRQSAEASSAGSTAGSASQARAALDRVQWAIVALLQEGVRHIVLTLGPLGAALCRSGPGPGLVSVQHLPAAPAQVISTSGAGDCLVAGCAAALLAGAQPLRMLATGLAVAGQAVQCRENVPQLVEWAATQQRAEELLSKVSSWQYVAQSRL